MESVVETIVNVLMLSSMYILVAMGFALVLSIMGVLNFAHGALYMIGGYVCYQLATQFGINQWLAMVLATVILSLFGLLLEKFCFRPFFGDINRTIIMSIVIALVLETTVNITVGDRVTSLPAFASGMLKAGPVLVSWERTVTMIVGGILLLFVTLFISRTKVGQQMLAVAQDPEGAILQGIRIHRVSALAIAMGCAMAAVAGSLMGAIFQLKPFVGNHMLVKSIQVVILSGIGSIGGILAGGFIIGALDAILPLFASGAVTQAVGLAVIVVLLLFRPQGLFGREVP
jgi:branched-chain amino acid transport system permease protein